MPNHLAYKIVNNYHNSVYIQSGRLTDDNGSVIGDENFRTLEIKGGATVNGQFGINSALRGKFYQNQECTGQYVEVIENNFCLTIPANPNWKG